MAEAGLPGRRRQPRDRAPAARSATPSSTRPDVPVISFTGSSATGKRLAAKAGARLKRVSLELGGKNGVVVLADADLDLATDGILWSAFGTTGQRCTAASRVIVERAVARPAARAPGDAGPGAAPRRRPGRPRPTSGRSSTPAPSTRSRRTSISGAAKASWSLGGERATDGRPGPRPLLRADDLQRGRRRWTASARRRSSGRSWRSSRSTATARRCWPSTRPATACRRASSPAT